MQRTLAHLFLSLAAIGLVSTSLLADENLPIKRLSGGVNWSGTVAAAIQTPSVNEWDVDAVDSITNPDAIFDSLGLVFSDSGAYANANQVIEAELLQAVDDTSLVPQCNLSGGFQTFAIAPSCDTSATAWQYGALSLGGTYEILAGTSEETDATLSGNISLLMVPLVDHPDGILQVSFGARVGATNLLGFYNGPGSGWSVSGTLSYEDGTTTSYSGSFGDDINAQIPCGQPVSVGEQIQMSCITGVDIQASANCGINVDSSTNWWGNSIAVWFEVIQD